MPLFLRPKEVDPPCTQCPHPQEQGYDYCEICDPKLGVSPAWCHDDNCSVKSLELPQPHIKFMILARSCDTEEEYVNAQHHHFGSPYKIVKVVRATKRGNVEITFWADHLKEWLSCEVPPNYRLTTAPEYFAVAARPPAPNLVANRARAAHLAQYRRSRAELAPAPARPEACIVGQIGAEKVLVDAGDGTVLSRYPVAGFNPVIEAQKLGRTLVTQGEASSYALTMLRRAWADAKKS